MKGNKGALEKTTLFPHGNKPFNYGRKKDDDEVQLLALGQIISQQDKIKDNSEGDKDTTGAMKDTDGHDALLGNLDDDWEFNGRASPGQDSIGSLDLDYSSDKSETGFVKASGDKEEKDSIEDNSTFGEQGDKTEAPEEIIVGAKKPVLTQQVIMDLIENQASLKRTASDAGWERRKEEYSQMLDGYESPTSRTVQVDVPATLMIISAVAENTNS